MLGAGTFINPIIKIVTVAGILAAVYFFIVKPVTETTDNAFDTVNDTFQGATDLSNDLKSQIDDALQGTSADPQKMRKCIQAAIDAGAGQSRIQSCVDRFGS